MQNVKTRTGPMPAFCNLTSTQFRKIIRTQPNTLRDIEAQRRHLSSIAFNYEDTPRDGEAGGGVPEHASVVTQLGKCMAL